MVELMERECKYLLRVCLASAGNAQANKHTLSLSLCISFSLILSFFSVNLSPQIELVDDGAMIGDTR
jgi:hypothetical protein